MIGESAGAIICAPSIQYIEQMDEKPEDYSQEDDASIFIKQSFYFFEKKFIILFSTVRELCKAEDGIRDKLVTGVQTCALPIS